VKIDRKTVCSNPGEVAERVAHLRKKGKTLVTTNGCFDILHAGHVAYLAEAAALGDVLAVGVNSDAVVTKLKGSNRPVQSQVDRVAIVGALRMVDFAFIFEEEDPRAFLSILKPDVHVKGGDYDTDIIERPVVEKYGGTVKTVSFMAGRSTSSLIAGIRK
jgi:glycerol-3-phosphate cytidylyltransferase